MQLCTVLPKTRQAKSAGPFPPGKTRLGVFAAEMAAFPVVCILLWINVMSQRNRLALHDMKAPCLFTLF